MKSFLIPLFLSLSSCSGGSPQELASDGGDCIYNSEQNGVLRYVSAEEFIDSSDPQSSSRYLIEFETLLEGSPPEYRHQLVTSSCKREFEEKKQTSVRIIKLQWGGCVPVRIKPLELSDACSQQFIGNDF